MARANVCRSLVFFPFSVHIGEENRNYVTKHNHSTEQTGNARTHEVTLGSRDEKTTKCRYSDLTFCFFFAQSKARCVSVERNEVEEIYRKESRLS